MKETHSCGWMLGVTLVVLVGASGCRRAAEPEVKAAPALPETSVRVRPVEARPQVLTEEVVGTVRAKVRTTVESKVSGRIEQLPVRMGQTVRAGELLVQLDAREIQARLDQALALRRQAERDQDRFQALLRQEAVTQAEFDAVDARHRVAAAAVTEAETLLAYTRVVAPFNGVITRRWVEVGDLAAPGRPLIEIEDPETLQLEADVPEALVARVQLGAKMPVRLDTLDASLEGVVSEMAPAADAVSRTSRVKLDLPSTKGLRAGQFGRVRVPVAEGIMLRVPETALVVRGQLELVFVVTNQSVQMRLVRTGPKAQGEVQLLAGVQGGEMVVVEGAGTLLDGQPVRVSADP